MLTFVFLSLLVSATKLFTDPSWVGGGLRAGHAILPAGERRKLNGVR